MWYKNVMQLNKCKSKNADATEKFSANISFKPSCYIASYTQSIVCHMHHAEQGGDIKLCLMVQKLQMKWIKTCWKPTDW
uniref:Uncharacterized protein n=1 Tax=Rhizophora mucronata TaxID=61149 RepID=A0A2P2MXE8_RHIMU